MHSCHPLLYCHLHRYSLVRIVPNQLQVLVYNIIDRCLVGVDLECRKLTRLSLQLFFQRINMVQVYMSISYSVHKVTRKSTSDMCNQVRQESVRCNVKWHTQPHVSRPLVHLTRDLVALSVYKELAKHVTGWKRHERKIGRIPCRHDDAAVFRSVYNLVQTVCQLVKALTSVVSVHVNILCPKVSPLKAIDWTQITNFAMR
jgi:hypothetical protein